ncbi:MAG TPA: hypothetical protein VN870_01270, partial [Streptosporangiaceae bacterium]|nr:hypothetical protein [Streptosporangiaceae bacterium]
HTFTDFSLQDLDEILQRHNLITESRIGGLTWGFAVLADIYCVALAERAASTPVRSAENCRIRWVSLCKYLRVDAVYLQA